MAVSLLWMKGRSQVSRRRGQVGTGKGAVMFLLRFLGEGLAPHISMAVTHPRLKGKLKQKVKKKKNRLKNTLT